ncbi:hypothetical protein AX17_003246 [Amanita inopinata Kibby_2008]|nr:hypothetical protein AX17_003246 [Amanita inopinata Kibby_2008]
MPLLDRITDAIAKIAPLKAAKASSMSNGLRSGHGIVPFDDNMIVSKPTIISHTSQIFFNFLAMACFASVAAFQAKWGVGPSGLTGFAIFVSIAGMFLSSFMLLIPVIYEKYDKLVRVARALKEVRVAFILTGTGVSFSLLIAFVTTISAWTQPGCKNPDNDPHGKEKGDEFKRGLPNWCNTKKAGAIFFWIAFVFWAISLGLLVFYWRTGKLAASRDPTFIPPHDDEGDDEESTHNSISPANRPAFMVAAADNRYDNPGVINSTFEDPNRYSSATAYSGYPTSGTSVPSSIPRPSMDAYGAFSDPAPSGFINTPAAASNYAASNSVQNHPPIQPAPSNTSPSVLFNSNAAPRVSRTMQYADPYAAVRTSLAGQGSPPSYESYSGYH